MQDANKRKYYQRIIIFFRFNYSLKKFLMKPLWIENIMMNHDTDKTQNSVGQPILILRFMNRGTIK